MKPALAPACRTRELRVQHGFSYMEVLVATALLALVLAPALESLQTGTLAAGVHERTGSLHYRAAGRMQDLLAQPFHELDTAALAAGSASVASSYSDASGSSERRLVYLARYDVDDADGDGDRFTGGDEGILWLRVTIEGSNVALDGLRRW